MDLTVRKTILLTALFLTSAAAIAQAPPIPEPPAVTARSYYVADATTGVELASLNPDERVEPASLTKLMTAYVVFNELESGSLSLDQMVNVSEKAWKTEGSRMFLKVNESFPVEELLKGMIIQSGNDASVALAEHVAGSEETFARLMNQYAERLGMSGSNFVNSTGLPHENHYTTARDMVKLSTALIKEFPKYYGWYSEKEYTFNNISQRNRNQLLWRDESVDGLKTGHTSSAGYCLAASAKRGNQRVVAATMGSDSASARASDMQSLLTYGFRFFETHTLYQAGKEIQRAKLWKGEADDIAVTVAKDVAVTIPRGRYDDLNAAMDINKGLTAPIAKGEQIGTLNVTLDGKPYAEVPLVAMTEAAEGGFLRRLQHSIALWFED